MKLSPPSTCLYTIAPYAAQRRHSTIPGACRRPQRFLSLSLASSRSLMNLQHFGRLCCQQSNGVSRLEDCLLSPCS